MTELSVVHVAIDRLLPDPGNARKINDAESVALTRSIREFGFVQPIVARRDGTVIAGHQRLLAARRLGLDTVPVVWLDISAEQGRLLGLALNRISGEWDEPLLVRLLADLEDSVDLTLSGFGDDELKDLLHSMEARERRDRPESFDLDEALEATKKPRTKPVARRGPGGQCWGRAMMESRRRWTEREVRMRHQDRWWTARPLVYRWSTVTGSSVESDAMSLLIVSKPSKPCARTKSR